MLIIAWLILWFIAALGFAVTFENCYPLWSRKRSDRPGKSESAQAYWCIVCLLSFIVGGNPLAPLAVLPLAVSHFDLTRHASGRLTVAAVLSHVPGVLRAFLKKIFR